MSCLTPLSQPIVVPAAIVYIFFGSLPAKGLSESNRQTVKRKESSIAIGKSSYRNTLHHLPINYTRHELRTL